MSERDLVGRGEMNFRTLSSLNFGFLRESVERAVLFEVSFWHWARHTDPIPPLRDMTRRWATVVSRWFRLLLV